MDKNQSELWAFLCTLSGEEVARLFLNFYGNEKLSPEFREFVEEEGYDVESCIY